MKQYVFDDFGCCIGMQSCLLCVVASKSQKIYLEKCDETCQRRYDCAHVRLVKIGFVTEINVRRVVSVDSNEPCENAARMVLSTDNGYIFARVA
jgi:hypothetical protein